MPRSLHFDLRCRVLKAIDEGLSCREAAARFGVSASSAIRWAELARGHAKRSLVGWTAEGALRRAGGDGRPKSQGGDRLSRRTEAHAGLVAAALADVPDITLLELKEHLARQGAFVSVTALWRFFRRHAITRKKRPRTPPSRTVPTSARRGRSGSRANSISIPNG